jgi:DNA (cytosine-5)-methyltransferase 1
MEKLKILDLFSGIGGFSLGLERTGGFETVAFCEIESFPQKILAKHWPGVPIYDDVRTLTAERLAADGIAEIDVITGGFPCQDLSTAGKRKGMESGTRSGLWSEIIRIAGELRPRFIIVENVAGLLSGPSDNPGRWFGRVLGDLAECGYDAEWENIPAAALGAPHRRERVWIVADSNRDRLQEDAAENELCHASYFDEMRRRLSEVGSSREWDQPRPIGACPMAVGNGIPEWVGGIKAYGNAVVPQIPELIGHAILSSMGKSS